MGTLPLCPSSIPALMERFTPLAFFKKVRGDRLAYSRSTSGDEPGAPPQESSMSLKYFLPFALHSLCQARKSEIGTHAETPAHKLGLLPAMTNEVYPPPEVPIRKILFRSTLVCLQAYSTASTISLTTKADPVACGLRLGPRKSGCR